MAATGPPMMLPRSIPMPQVKAMFSSAAGVSVISTSSLSGRSRRMLRSGNTTSCPHPWSLVRLKTNVRGAPAAASIELWLVLLAVTVHSHRAHRRACVGCSLRRLRLNRAGALCELHPEATKRVMVKMPAATFMGTLHASYLSTHRATTIIRQVSVFTVVLFGRPSRHPPSRVVPEGLSNRAVTSCLRRLR